MRHDKLRALRLGFLFGLPITLPALVYAIRSGDFPLTFRNGLFVLLWTEALGAVAAFRTPLPTRRRVAAGAALYAIIAAILLVQETAGAGSRAGARFYAGLVLLPFAAWLVAGWKAGLMSLSLFWMWVLIAYSS